MAKQTSFSLKDAKSLQHQLGELYQTWQQWERVKSQWRNIQLVWKDEQFYKFEHLFTDLSETYNDAIEKCHQYRGFLDQQIKIAEEKRFKLGEFFDNSVTVLQAGVSLLGTNSTPVQIPISTIQQPNSSYVQQAEFNACLLNEKSDLKQSPADHWYNSLPGVARVSDFEEQLDEVYGQEREKKTRQNKINIETSIITDGKSSISEEN